MEGLCFWMRPVKCGLPPQERVRFLIGAAPLTNFKKSTAGQFFACINSSTFNIRVKLVKHSPTTVSFPRLGRLVLKAPERWRNRCSTALCDLNFLEK
jgi:hypothetical protein